MEWNNLQFYTKSQEGYFANKIDQLFQGIARKMCNMCQILNTDSLSSSNHHIICASKSWNHHIDRYAGTSNHHVH